MKSKFKAFNKDYQAQNPTVLIIWQIALSLRYAHYINNPLTLILGSKTLRKETKEYLKESFNSRGETRRLVYTSVIQNIKKFSADRDVPWLKYVSRVTVLKLYTKTFCQKV